MSKSFLNGPSSRDTNNVWIMKPRSNASLECFLKHQSGLVSPSGPNGSIACSIRLIRWYYVRAILSSM